MARARERILRAAERLVLTGGYHATGTNAIIAAAGVSKGSFFYHFPQKQDLAVALLKRSFENAIERPIAQAFGEHGNAQDALTEFLGGLEGDFRKNRFHGGCLLGNLTAELGDGEPEIQQCLAGLFDRWRRLLIGHLAGVRLTMDVEDFADLFIAQIEGVMLTVRACKAPETADQAFGACRRFIAQALAVEQRTAESRQAGHFYHAQLGASRAGHQA